MGSLRRRGGLLAAIGALVLSGCAVHDRTVYRPANVETPTAATKVLRNLPPAGQKVPVAVYGFTDQTGQFKPTDGAQTLSRAVTQGATSILMKALHEAGQRGWFTVIERERLDNLLRERAVIREMRASYLGEKQLNPNALPPLLFAGMLLEGGIIGYDTNTKSGGLGARFLGVGARTQYREDTVTVYLRAVSVKTGEVLASVSVRKSIASIAYGADAFRFVEFKELLEAETGVTFNEPDQLALQRAIEKSIYALIMEGAMQDLWCLNANDATASSLLTSYMAERDSMKADQVTLPRTTTGAELTGSCASSAAGRAVPSQVQPSLTAVEEPAEVETDQQPLPEMAPEETQGAVTEMGG